MGMFDYVKGPRFDCLNCDYNQENHTWQTKQLENMMGTYYKEMPMPEYLDDKLEVHSLCPQCGAFIQGYVKIDENHLLTDEIEIDEDECHIFESKEDKISIPSL